METVAIVKIEFNCAKSQKELDAIFPYTHAVGKKEQDSLWDIACELQAKHNSSFRYISADANYDGMFFKGYTNLTERLHRA